jgi:hypothetical protein
MREMMTNDIDDESEIWLISTIIDGNVAIN